MALYTTVPGVMPNDSDGSARTAWLGQCMDCLVEKLGPRGGNPSK